NRRGSFERDNSGDNRSFGRNEYSDKRGDRPQRGGFRPSSDSSNRSSRNFSVRRGREDGRGREERDNQRGGYQRGGERGGYQRDRRDYNYDRPKESVFRA